MSAIIKTETVLSQVTVGYVCDICGLKSESPNFPNEWHHFEHHHHDWGNDSIDSYEYFHVCSIDCFTKQLSNSINKLDGRHDAEVADMNIGFAKSLLQKLLK